MVSCDIYHTIIFKKQKILHTHGKPPLWKPYYTINVCYIRRLQAFLTSFPFFSQQGLCASPSLSIPLPLTLFNAKSKGCFSVRVARYELACAGVRAGQRGMGGLRRTWTCDDGSVRTRRMWVRHRPRPWRRGTRVCSGWWWWERTAVAGTVHEHTPSHTQSWPYTCWGRKEDFIRRHNYPTMGR